MVATTVALAIDILKVKIEDEHTTSHWIRLSLFFILPPFIAIISTTIIAIAVHHSYTADKLVRFIFPYVKRKGGNNVVFGFKLDEYHILTLLWVAIEVVYYVIWAFWFNIILIYPNNSNPHDAYSYELNCYYLNYTEIELSTAERLTTKEAIKCIGFNSNIAGAMSQVTGILGFTWILVSILTWILLNVKHCVINIKHYVMKKCDRTQCKQCKQCKHTCSKCSLFYYIVIHIVHLSIDIAWIAIIVNYNDKKWYSYVATPENNLLIAVFLGSVSVIGFPIEKATPKTLEELCREAMKKKTQQEREQIIKKKKKSTQIAEYICNIEFEEHCRERVIQEDTPHELTQSILKEMIKHECKRLLASKAITNTNEEEMKRIFMNTFNSIISQEELKLLTCEPIAQNTPPYKETQYNGHT